MSDISKSYVTRITYLIINETLKYNNIINIWRMIFTYNIP